MAARHSDAAESRRTEGETLSETRERTALEVLRKIEWDGVDCPVCGAFELDGHAPDCALDAVLRATPASDGGEVRGDAPAGATLYRRRCGWCGAYEGTVDPKEPCAKDEIGYIGPHQFEVLEAVVSGSGTPQGEGEEHGYWWCPECLEEVDSSRVTYTECHDSCGREVVWKDPLPPVNEDVRARLDQINYRWHSGAKLSDKEVGDLLGIAYTLATRPTHGGSDEDE